MKNYVDLFTPNKIGGKFFLNSVYPRSFFAGLNGSVFGVIFVKLQSQVLTLQEIAILGQVLTLGVLFVPLLGMLRLRMLTMLTILTELIAVLIPVLFAVGVIDAKVFLYAFTLLEFCIIVVYSNLSSVFANFEQSKTKPETAEFRSRGKMVTSAVGGTIGTILVVILSGISENITHILYLLIAIGVIGNILFFVTNRRLVRFAEDDIKYPIVREINK